MKHFVFILSLLFVATFSSEGATYSSQQVADLKNCITRIQILAKTAQSDAKTAAQSESNTRAELDVVNQSLVTAKGQLNTANQNADILQQQVNQQAKDLQSAISDRDTAREGVKNLTLENRKLTTILGIEAAAIVFLICLYLGLPNLAPPWGMIATLALPALVFGAVKLFL